MLLAALEDPISAPAAAMAIKDLCDCCGQFMAPCMQQLLGMYHKALEAGQATREAAAAAVATAAAGPQAVIGGPVLTAAQRDAAATAAAAAAAAAAGGRSAGGLHEEDVQHVIQGVAICMSR
jgi:hypothetical protein